MKRILLACALFHIAIFSSAQENMWAWIKGDTVGAFPAVFGEQGVPGMANSPSGAYNALGWVDNDGMFWMMGGSGYFGWRNDLWRFNPETLEWTWMKGSQEGNDPGSYGEMGVPAESNTPPSRGFGSANWTDLDGNLWMYGGYSNYSATSGAHYHADMWKYDVESNMWTWMNGPQESLPPPVYGMAGVPSADNHPGARSEVCANWVDLEGNLWLFGGMGGIEDDFINNDLWMYDVELNQWAFIRGDQIDGAPSVYGTQGVPDEQNQPSGRNAYGSWVDSEGNFWLMGGYESSASKCNDLWRYNPYLNEWTWMKGASESGSLGHYGTQGVFDIQNEPPARFENKVNWVKCDRLFMFGGNLSALVGDTYQNWLNDLWVYDINTNRWAWLKGDSLGVTPSAHYSEMGVFDEENTPMGTSGSLVWFDGEESAYLFGGYRHVSSADFNGVSPEIWQYKMEELECPLGTNDRITTANFEAYPNPTSGWLNLRLAKASARDMELVISNTVGQELAKMTLRDVNEHTLIAIPESIPNGIYMFTLSDGNYQNTKRIVIQRD